jgi:hypothetical protein
LDDAELGASLRIIEHNEDLMLANVITVAHVDRRNDSTFPKRMVPAFSANSCSPIHLKN